MKQAGNSAGQIVIDWLSIRRQQKYLAWALIALSIAYLVIQAISRR